MADTEEAHRMCKGQPSTDGGARWGGAVSESDYSASNALTTLYIVLISPFGLLILSIDCALLRSHMMTG